MKHNLQCANSEILTLLKGGEEYILSNYSKIKVISNLQYSTDLFLENVYHKTSSPWTLNFYIKKS